MSIKYTLAAVALSGALFTTAAQAQDQKSRLTVQDLYTFCTPTPGDTTAACVGYVGGVMDSMVFNQVLSTALTENDAKRDLATKAMCGEVTYGAAVQAFKNWAQQNPKLWSMPGYMGVVTALAATWPCLVPK